MTLTWPRAGSGGFKSLRHYILVALTPVHVTIRGIIGAFCFLPLQDTFVELYGNNAAAESRKGQERFNRWLLTGVTVAGVVLLGSLFSRK